MADNDDTRSGIFSNIINSVATSLPSFLNDVNFSYAEKIATTFKDEVTATYAFRIGVGFGLVSAAVDAAAQTDQQHRANAIISDAAAIAVGIYLGPKAALLTGLTVSQTLDFFQQHQFNVSAYELALNQYRSYGFPVDPYGNPSNLHFFSPLLAAADQNLGPDAGVGTRYGDEPSERGPGPGILAPGYLGPNTDAFNTPSEGAVALGAAAAAAVRQGTMLGSCPQAWCSFWGATAVTGLSRDGQAAARGRLTMGSSPIGAMLSSVM